MIGGMKKKMMKWKILKRNRMNDGGSGSDDEDFHDY